MRPQAVAPEVAPEQCTVTASTAPASRLHTSKRPFETTHSTSTPCASMASGCRKYTAQSALAPAARAISRYPAPGKTTRPCTTWSATRACSAPAVGDWKTTLSPADDGRLRCAKGCGWSRHRKACRRYSSDGAGRLATGERGTSACEVLAWRPPPAGPSPAPARLAPDGPSASAADESGTPPTPRCSPPRPTAITACAIVPEYPNELTPADRDADTSAATLPR